MSREFFVLFDEATGAEMSRGSGPEGVAALQERPGAIVRTVAKADFRSERALTLDLTTGEAKPTSNRNPAR